VLTPEKQDRDNFGDAVSHIWQQVANVKKLTEKDAGRNARIAQLETWITEELRQLNGNLQTKETLKIYHSEAADFRRDRVRRPLKSLRTKKKAFCAPAMRPRWSMRGRSGAA